MNPTLPYIMSQFMEVSNAQSIITRSVGRVASP
jgi:hypothetical protein